MKNAIDQMSEREIFIDDKLTSLDVNVRRKGIISIIHLINYSSYGGRPIKDVIPLKDIKLTICLPNSPTTVKTLRSSGELKFSYKSGKLTFTVPEIKEYEIVLLYFELSKVYTCIHTMYCRINCDEEWNTTFWIHFWSCFH